MKTTETKSKSDDRMREKVRYLFVGVATTAVNVAVFAALDQLAVPVIPATAAAWAASVAFSFIASKSYVYRSDSRSLRGVASEAARFVSGRTATGAFDVFAMWLLCDEVLLPALPMKLAVNILVVAANYFLGRVAFSKATTGCSVPAAKDVDCDAL